MVELRVKGVKVGMGLVSSLLRSERSREARVQEETIERWKRNAASPPSEDGAGDGESVRVISRERQLELTPTLDLNAEVVAVSESWSVKEEVSTDSWTVDTTYLDSALDLFEEERIPRWSRRAVRKKESTPVHSNPSPGRVPTEGEPETRRDAVRNLTERGEMGGEEITSGDGVQFRGLRPKGDEPPLTIEEDLKRRFGGNIRSAIGPGTVIEGKLSFDSPVRIDGMINGEVTSTSTLIIGEQAVVKAKLRVGGLIVLGQVEGDVLAAETVEIRRGGQLEGDVVSRSVMIELGGYFEGKSTPVRQ